MVIDTNGALEATRAQVRGFLRCAAGMIGKKSEISMREIVLDTETTGLSPAEGHRLVEIGCLEIVNQIATGAVYHVLINPERDVPDDAYRIHGHSTAFLADKPVFAQIVA